MENKKCATICIFDDTTSDHFGNIYDWSFELLDYPAELSESELRELIQEIRDGIEPHVGFRGSRPYADIESFPSWIKLVSSNAIHRYPLSKSKQKEE